MVVVALATGTKLIQAATAEVVVARDVQVLTVVDLESLVG
jgi:hypothetical protein